MKDRHIRRSYGGRAVPRRPLFPGLMRHPVAAPAGRSARIGAQVLAVLVLLLLGTTAVIASTAYGTYQQIAQSLTPRLDALSNAVGYAGQQLYVSAAGAGFDTNTVQGIILGGWCDSFGKCAVPTGAMQNRTSTSLQIPVTLNSPGTYTLYLFNAASGKTSNGKQITIY